MKRLLVTGGAGFIGSNFIKLILKRSQGLSIINLDKLTYCGNLDNLRDIEKNPRYKFIKGDITDRNLVNEVVNDADAVINFAAESHVDRSIVNPSAFLDTNVFGTMVLLDASRKRGIKRFLQVSTDEVYGSLKKGSAGEDFPLHPNSPYAASKASADLLVKSYFATYGFNTLIARSSNNFGPNQYPEKVMPLFITNLLEDKALPLYGSGKNVREWLYVLDNCEALLKVLEKGKPGEVYNIGSGNELDNIGLAKSIIKIFKKNNSCIRFVADRPGHDFRYSLNSAKIKKLGWKPRFNFDSALKDTVLWYRENKHWWKVLKDKAEIIKW